MASTLSRLFGGGTSSVAETSISPANVNQIPPEFSVQLSRLQKQLGGRDPMAAYNALNLNAEQRAKVKAVADKIYSMFPH